MDGKQLTADDIIDALADVLRIVEAGKTPPQGDDEFTCDELARQAGITYNQMVARLRAQVAAGKLTRRMVRAHSGRNAQAYRAARPRGS